nr:MAG TPA: hypothetical protein [Caudoviricetes sp.]
MYITCYIYCHNLPRSIGIIFTTLSPICSTT